MQSSDPAPFAGSWFLAGDDQCEYLFSREKGAISTRTTVMVDGHEHPIVVLSGSGVWVQLSPDTLRALAGSTSLSTMLRRVGVGRVRKDLSTPLQPGPDDIWLQGPNDNAVLVWRILPDADRFAFFRIGPLAGPCRIMRAQGCVGLMIFAAEDFLPEASYAHLQQVVAERRAFGALISCTQEDESASGSDSH